MNVRVVVGVILAGFAAGSCGSDTPDEGATQRLRQALSDFERIVNFEGSLTPGAGADWVAQSGTNAGPSSTAFEGAQALSLSGSSSPTAVSIPFSMGAMATNATVRVRVPTSLQGQPHARILWA